MVIDGFDASIKDNVFFISFVVVVVFRSVQSFILHSNRFTFNSVYLSIFFFYKNCVFHA